MMDPAVHFILNRVAADYVRLYKAGIAPAAECYAQHWSEHAEVLVQTILFTEFRLRRETPPPLSVEAFLRDYPAYRDNEDLILRLLEYELEHSDAEPNMETLRLRFPRVDSDRLVRSVELAQMRRSLKVSAAAPPPKVDATVTVHVPQNTADAATDVWRPEQAKSVEWTVQQMAEPDADWTLDFQDLPPVATMPPDATLNVDLGTMANLSEGMPEGAAETADFELPAVLPAPPAPFPPSAASVPASCPESADAKMFTMSDSLTVDKFLGSGYWKDVYKAKQQSTQQYVALKHLRENNEEELLALVREVRTQAMLTHQNIPPVFALDVLPSGQAIVVEKLVDGERWSDTIKSRTLEDNLRILLDVAQALSFAHRQHRIIHRDLKPDNVVINDKYHEVYVIDWGLAADAGEEPSGAEDKVPHVRQLSGIAGTPLYWAPELADGSPTRCCPATDVFLLGALLYEVLTGSAPYRLCNPKLIDGLRPEEVEEIRSLEVGSMLRAVRGIIIPPRLWAPNRYMPEELVAIALKSLSRLPEDRYVDAGDFIDAVKQYQHFSLITSRCNQNWKQFAALCKARDQALAHPDAQLSLTLRFLEVSDIFRNVASELQLHQITDEVDSGEVDSGMDTPTALSAHPTLLSAQRGEAEARTELIALTLRSGDLTLADAQIGLVERNPFHHAEKIRSMRHQVQALKISRHRARMMKWVAVSLLAVFLGTSMLYGYLINEQYKETALQHHRAEENYQRAEENYQRAEENLYKARSAVNDFFTNVAKDDNVKNAAGLMSLRRMLLDLARQYHDDFVSQRSDDPEVIAGQIGSLFDMAGIETHFGNRHHAIDYYLQAIERGEELVQKYPQNVDYLDILAKCYKDIAVVYGEEGYPPELVFDYNQKALILNRRMVEEFGTDPEYHRNLARILHNLGVWKMRHGDGEGAEQYFRESLTVRKGMSRFEDPPEFHYGQAQTYFALALLHVDKNRFDDADREFEAARQLLDELYDLYPDRFQNDEMAMQGSILFGQGEMNFNSNKPAAARSSFVRAAELFGILVEKAPEDIGYQRQLNYALSLLFECLVQENRDETALELFRQREESLLQPAVLFPDIILFLSQWYLRVAEFHLERERADEAVESLQSGLELLDILEEDRTPEEETLWRKIQTRLWEVLSEE